MRTHLTTTPLPPRRSGQGGPTPGRANPPKEERQAAFLEAYRLLGVISTACQAVDVPSRLYYFWMKQDADFAGRFKEAHEAVVDEAEAELRRRGIHGDAEPVFYQGTQCGTVQRKSDACLIFYLKGRRGDVFRERATIGDDPAGAAQLVSVAALEVIQRLAALSTRFGSQPQLALPATTQPSLPPIPVAPSNGNK